MESILQITKYLGAFAAIVLFIGFLSSSGITIDGHQDISSVEEMSFSTADPRRAGSEEGAVNAYDKPERAVRIHPEDANASERPDRATALPTGAPSRSRSASSTVSVREIEDWVQMNAAQTYLEAEKETMSPGVILATGIYFLQQGKGDASMNAASVAGYLAEVRQSATAAAKSHMKYIANSDEWFQGLNLAGFDGDRLAAIFATHQLAAFDKQMYTRHVEKKIEQPTYTGKDATLAADQHTRSRSLAVAYNDYADRPEVRAKYNLPTRIAAKPMDRREVTQGRQEAEQFALGETRTYQDPRIFSAVLQEIIALEQGYPSWNDYKAANVQAANKEFQIRSNIMSMGGMMKVTRKKGA